MERPWQHIHLLSDSNLSLARLGPRFIDMSLRYAVEIRNVLLLKNVTVRDTPTSEPRQSTAHEKYYSQAPGGGAKPRIPLCRQDPQDKGL